MITCYRIKKLFVLLIIKFNLQSDKMFQGELESLKAIRDTQTVTVPNPITIGSTLKNSTKNNQYFIVLKYFKFTSLNPISSAELGSQLAEMHLSNLRQKSSLVLV